METKIKYSFIVLSKYKCLEDGTPNWHHTSAMEIQGKGTILQFLTAMQANSKTDGLSIVDINFEIL